MSNVAIIEQPRRPERIQVVDVIPVLDTGRFDQMTRIASVMAKSGLIPETLCYDGTVVGEDGVERKNWLALEVITARCFLIVNQAVGWRMDPFAVAQCASMVKGRLCWEGKLIAAVLDNSIGIQLKYEWNDKTGDALGITVSATLPGELEPRTVEGTVGEWKTTHNGSPWRNQARKQLAYRGAREWGRLHAPRAMLGVYTPEDMDASAERQSRLPPPPPPVPGASLPPSPPQGAIAPPAPSPEPPKAQAEPPKPPEPPAPPPPPPPPEMVIPGVEIDTSGGRASFTEAKAATGPIDFDAFRAALDQAKSNEELNAIYDREVMNRKPPLTTDEADEADSITREIGARFWEVEASEQ